MALLAGVSYDPGTAASFSTASLLAMTAIDTTNLRLTFTAPANGIVLVRLKTQHHGSTTPAEYMLGVLDGSTVKGRQPPMGVWVGGGAATGRYTAEASFLVTGLTPTSSYTWDAACGVEGTGASSFLKWGGPDNATGDDAFGAFDFEIWETENLLAGTMYDPGGAAASKVLTSLLAMTAFDTTNLRLAFTAPASGKVMWRIRCISRGSSGAPGDVFLGILEASTVVGRTVPIYAQHRAGTANSPRNMEASGLITGLTPSSSYTYDAAYGIEVVAAAGGQINYGGPNDATSGNAWGGVAFEIWKA